MKNHEVLLFDLDGTLIDTKEGIAKSIQYALSNIGITLEDLASLEKLIGPPIREMLQEQFSLEGEQLQQAIDHRREYYRNQGMFESEPYKGIEDFLKEAQNQQKRLMIATAMPTIFANDILRHHKLLKYFERVQGSDLEGKMTSKRDIIQAALALEGPDSRKVSVMIGDRMHDIIGARENAIDSIGILYGYGSREELESVNPTFIVQDLESLARLLLA